MRYFGQWEPPVDKFLYDNYFKDKMGGFFIECGALDGIKVSSCYFFELYKGWSGVNIEPVPFLFNKLIKNRLNSVNLNIALSNVSSVLEFSHVIHPRLGSYFGNSSLNHSKNQLNKLVKSGCKFKKFMVSTLTYKDLVEKYNICVIDLFVLDVEGHELEVLEGIGDCKVLPGVFCVEFPQVGIENLNNVLGNFGYKLDKISHNNAYYIK